MLIPPRLIKYDKLNLRSANCKEIKEMNRFKKITLIYLLYIVLVICGVGISICFAVISNGYFVDEVLNVFYCAIVFTFFSFFFWSLSFLLCRALLKSQFSLHKCLVFDTQLNVSSKYNGEEVNNASTFYINNLYNINTFAIYEIEALDINKIKETRRNANNVIYKRFKKANSISYFLPHWHYQVNIFRFNGMYKMSKVFQLIKEMNQYKHLKDGRVNYFYLARDQKLVIKTYDGGKFSLRAFIAYRKSLKRIAKVFELDFKELWKRL